jgi:hypothetical protein
MVTSVLMYHHEQMRRVLSIILVLFFGIGPLPASFRASVDTRLPSCCRRHGAHHCAMSKEIAAQMVRSDSGSTPFLSAPSRCPWYPDNSPATTSPVHALAGHFANSIVSVVQTHALTAPQAVRCKGLIRTHAGRAPPPMSLA